MSQKLNLARIKRNGQTFEIAVDSDKALAYKDGNATLSEVLQAEQIFTDAKKGQVAGNDELEHAFETSSVHQVADIILTKGEIQSTSEHRAKEREQRHKQLVHMIHAQAIDPKTGLPHPVTRIEAALEQAKVHLLDHKSVEEQFDEIIHKLRPIIPLKIETKQLEITISGTLAGKCQQVIRSQKLVGENWLSDGSWKVIVELPAGLIPDFIDKVNSQTHGDAIIEEKK